MFMRFFEVTTFCSKFLKLHNFSLFLPQFHFCSLSALIPVMARERARGSCTLLKCNFALFFTVLNFVLCPSVANKLG